MTRRLVLKGDEPRSIGIVFEGVAVHLSSSLQHVVSSAENNHLVGGNIMKFGSE